MTLPPYQFPGQIHNAMINSLHTSANLWLGELAQGTDESFRRFLKRNNFVR